MKHINTYENNKNQPKKGDYVYVELDDKSYKPPNFIGKFIRKSKRKKYPYVVMYDGTYYPFIKQHEHNERLIKVEEVIAFSKNLEDLDIYINSNKYNL